MKSESPFLRRIVGFLLAGLFLVGLVAFVFRAEIMEGTSDALSNNPLAAKHTSSDLQLEKSATYVLRPERNDIDFIQISRLRSGDTTVVGTPIGITLTNRGDSNSFPNIRIVLVNRSGQAVREQIFAERDYVHPARFEEADIELLLSLQPGETGFTAKPFYPELP